MEQDVKARPQMAPAGPGLHEALTRAIESDEARQRVAVRMRVRGGVRPQAYAFDFEASGGGTARARLECRLTGREGEAKDANISARDFGALLRSVVPAFAAPQAVPTFLPDTLVGILEITDGERTQRIYFAADPEQARTQGLTPPPALARATDAIYSLGAKLMGRRQVKP
jgi:hypothetical protein